MNFIVKRYEKALFYCEFLFITFQQIHVDKGGFLDSLTVCAKNSAGFGTQLFLLIINFAIWIIVHFTFYPALFLAFVACSSLVLMTYKFPMGFLKSIFIDVCWRKINQFSN
jgi:hypothetical protein